MLACRGRFRGAWRHHRAGSGGGGAEHGLARSSRGNDLLRQSGAPGSAARPRDLEQLARGIDGIPMSAIKIGLLHPGRQHSLQTALALQEGGMLAWYATTIFYDPEKWPYRIERYLPGELGERASRFFQRRFEPLLDPLCVRQHGRWGWAAGTAVRYMPANVTESVQRFTNRDFGRRVIRL